MNSLQESLFQYLLDDFAEPAFIVKADAPSFSLLASNYEQRFESGIHVNEFIKAELSDIFSFLSPGQTGYSVLQAGLLECLGSGHIVWLSGFRFFKEDSIYNATDQSFWHLELKPVSVTGDKTDLVLITSHPMDAGCDYTDIPDWRQEQTSELNRERLLNEELRLENAGLRLATANMEMGRHLVEQSEVRYLSILNSLPHIAWTTTNEVIIDFVNKRWYEFTGLVEEETEYWGWEASVHTEDYITAKSAMRKIILGTRGGEFDLRYKRADGQYRWHLCRVEPVFSSSGSVAFWIGTATDIEELKRLQQQKDDFINIASHELKTPLTSLKVSIQLINERKTVLSPLMHSNLMARATKSLDKIVQLVDDLLNVGKFTHGQLEMRKCWFKPAHLLSDYVIDLHSEAIHTLKFKGDLQLEIFADPKRIEQVLVNFVNNAVKYAPDSKEIIVEISNVGKKVKISVTDKGPGIPSDLLPHLFDRYYHAENRGFQNTGLGLGLYICAEIIDKHEGEIYVSSEPGKGSVFWFLLPSG